MFLLCVFVTYQSLFTYLVVDIHSMLCMRMSCFDVCLSWMDAGWPLQSVNNWLTLESIVWYLKFLKINFHSRWRPYYTGYINTVITAMVCGLEMDMGMGLPFQWDSHCEWESFGNGINVEWIVEMRVEETWKSMGITPFQWEIIPIDDCSWSFAEEVTHQCDCWFNKHSSANWKWFCDRWHWQSILRQQTFNIN